MGHITAVNSGQYVLCMRHDQCLTNMYLVSKPDSFHCLHKNHKKHVYVVYE